MSIPVPPLVGRRQVRRSMRACGGDNSDHLQCHAESGIKTRHLMCQVLELKSRRASASWTPRKLECSA